MKRLIAVIIIIVLFMGAFHADAAPVKGSNVIFTAINDHLVSLSDLTMPTYFYDVPYIPYTLFTDYFGVSSSFDSDANRLTLYNWDHVLVFDLNLGFSYNQQREAFLDSARQYNGTIYLPAEFTARQLGYYYTWFDTGPTIRIKTPSTLSDSLFINIVAESIQNNLADYLAAKEGTSAPTDTPPTIPVNPVHEPGPLRPIYFVFSGAPSAGCLSILNTLESWDIQATFIIDGNEIAKNESIVRKIAINGHSIGLGGNANEYPDGYPDSETLLSELKEQNRLLDMIIKTKTRIVIPSVHSILSGDMQNAISDSGYRLWGITYEPVIAEADTPATFYKRTVAEIGKQELPLIVRLNCNEFTADSLSDILSSLSRNNYTFHTISAIDTPPPQE